MQGLNMNIKDIIGGAAAGAAIGAVTDIGWQKGAMVGAGVIVIGPMISGLVGGVLPAGMGGTPSATVPK